MRLLRRDRQPHQDLDARALDANAHLIGLTRSLGSLTNDYTRSFSRLNNRRGQGLFVANRANPAAVAAHTAQFLVPLGRSNESQFAYFKTPQISQLAAGNDLAPRGRSKASMPVSQLG